MRRWFLSYHSPDEALAERLKAAIERKDADIDGYSLRPRTCGRAVTGGPARQGDRRGHRFHSAGRRTGLGDWQVAEYDEALDRRVKSIRISRSSWCCSKGSPRPGCRSCGSCTGSSPPIRRPRRTSRGCSMRRPAAARGPASCGATPSPYRGLAAMEEKDSDFFFGRSARPSRCSRCSPQAPNRLPVLLGNSGVGKSSLAQAGVLAALKRQAWPEAAGAGIEPGRRRSATAAAGAFSRSARHRAAQGAGRSVPADLAVRCDRSRLGGAPHRAGSTCCWTAKPRLPDLLDATERRYEELDQPKPPAFFLYIDQGEELYVRAEERQRRRFSETPGAGARRSAPARADEHALRFPRRAAERRAAVQCAPQDRRAAAARGGTARGRQQTRRRLLSARFETDGLATIIARRTAEEFDQGCRRVAAPVLPARRHVDADGQARRRRAAPAALPRSNLAACWSIAPMPSWRRIPGREDALRRVLTLRLATVREDGEPTRRRASRSEFSDEEWRLVSELADHPNRLLVTATPEGGETYAEVAHEAIFRRWEKLREWIAARARIPELAQRARSRAPAPGRPRPTASKQRRAADGPGARAGAELARQARRGSVECRTGSSSTLSIARANKAKRRAQRVQALIYVLLCRHAWSASSAG